MDNTKVYDFTENTEIFFAFLKYPKDQFFEQYPYLTQAEYDLTVSVINNDATNILINFIENTSTQELAEPYNLTPEECNKIAVDFAKRLLLKDKWAEFINEAEKRGLKLIL